MLRNLLPLMLQEKLNDGTVVIIPLQDHRRCLSTGWRRRRQLLLLLLLEREVLPRIDDPNPGNESACL